MSTGMMIAWIVLTIGVGIYAKMRGYPPHWFVFLSLCFTPVAGFLLLWWLGPNDVQVG